MINILSAVKVAEQLSCSRKFVYYLHNSGKLPGFKIADGKKGLRWFERDVDKFVLQRAGELGAGHDEGMPAPPAVPIDLFEVIRKRKTKLRLAI